MTFRRGLLGRSGHGEATFIGDNGTTSASFSQYPTLLAVPFRTCGSLELTESEQAGLSPGEKAHGTRPQAGHRAALGLLTLHSHAGFITQTCREGLGAWERPSPREHPAGELWFPEAAMDLIWPV